MNKATLANKIRRTVPAALLAVFIALTLLRPFPAVRAAEKAEYVRYVTYVLDLEKGIGQDDGNWAELFEVYYTNGEMIGFGLSDSGVFGLGFRHKTPGKGKTAISARVRIPENKIGYVAFGLRLADYTDVRTERKGIMICVDVKGRLGVYDPGARTPVFRETGFSFAEGRKIYLEDDADANVITVSVDDGGNRILLAECVIDEAGRSVTMDFPDGRTEPLTVHYWYDLYRDGYISMTTGIGNTGFSDVAVTLPCYSREPYEEPAMTVFGGENVSGIRHSGAPSEEKPSVDYGALARMILSGVLGLALAALAAVAAIKLIKTGRAEKAAKKEVETSCAEKPGVDSDAADKDNNNKETQADEADRV